MINVGGESDLGRIALNKSADDSDDHPGVVDPRNTLNALTAKEWLSESVSVWTQRGLGAQHKDAAIEKLHPAPFSYSDVRRIVRMYTKPGGSVLDPFSGIGSTLKAAALEGRNGIGIELYPDFVDLTYKRLQDEVPEENLTNTSQRVLCGDVRVASQSLDADSVDLVVTSPPYWSILNKTSDHKVKQTREANGLVTNYGNDHRDLANIDDYDEFIEELASSLEGSIEALKPKKYFVLIVGDFRHKSRYYMFHADLARALETRGLTLQASNVLYQRHKRVFPYGYPYAYVPNVHHQNVVVLRKLP